MMISTVLLLKQKRRFRFLRWNAADKIHVLDRLIGVCQPHEVRHMLEVIEPQFQRDFISLLPKEVSRCFFMFYDFLLALEAI